MPGIDNIIQDKLNRLESVPNALYGQVEKEQVKLLNQALKQIDLLARSGDGKVLLNAKNLAIIENIGNTMQATMFEGDYVKSVIEFSKEFDQQKVINKDYFDKAFGTFEDKALFDLTFDTAKKRAISQLASGAIAERFIEPLKEALTTNAASGATVTDITKFMFEYMTGRKGVDVKDGRLLGWIKQTASDNFAFADREYSNIIAEDLGVEWFRYAGGLIPTTRCFCEARNGKIFHKSEIAEWGTKPSLWAKNPDFDCKGGGMILGTNAQNIFTFLGGYGCQHVLLALPESSIPTEILSRIK